MNKISAILFVMILWLFPGCKDDTAGLEYTGTVEGTAVMVPALTAGEILQFYVQTGEFVTKGQLLAAVDSTELVFNVTS